MLAMECIVLTLNIIAIILIALIRTTITIITTLIIAIPIITITLILRLLALTIIILMIIFEGIGADEHHVLLDVNADLHLSGPEMGKRKRATRKADEKLAES